VYCMHFSRVGASHHPDGSPPLLRYVILERPENIQFGYFSVQ
jgi:hypothetical protein